MSKFQIQRFKQINTIASGGTAITGTAFGINGLLKGVIVDVPSLTSTDTITLAVKDADGYTIYSKASLAKSTVSANFVDANNQPLELPLCGSHTITLTSSGTEGADRAIPVVLLVQRG